MIRRTYPFLVILALCLGVAKMSQNRVVQAQATANESVVSVMSMAQLQQALRAARPGTRVEVAPGEYSGNLHIEGLRGEAGKPIVLAGADRKNPPIFKGDWHFAAPAYLEIRDLVIRDARSNGLNIDDGGQFDKPARGIVLRRVQVRDVGPHGNHDGFKLSGVDDFLIEECILERWGTGDGSGIDMVGCHSGLIEKNIFRHHEDQRQTGASGVQAKGGCRDIIIRSNRFENAGTRSINIGGSTGMQFFRPPLNAWPPNQARYEAKDIRIEGNTFIGSGAPLAFVGVDGSVARFNTIYRPKRWAMRILQETDAPGFVPSRNGIFEDNIIVFRSNEWSEGGVNIGTKTAPATFQFARNWWFCEDRPERSKPNLPTPEIAGVYGQDPLLRDQSTLDMRLQPNSPALKYGAEALPVENTKTQ